MYRWISCRDLIKKIPTNDVIFGGKYIVDLYQKCDFGCVYCDAAEDVIYIKHNAPDVLAREIKNIEKGTVILGSATDSYQRIEERTELSRNILSILVKENFPVHVLTKSTLVERDIDIIKKGDVSVTVSISTLDEKISKIIEPFAPPPGRRLDMVKRLKKEDIKVGLALFPFIPFISEIDIEHTIERISGSGANYLIFDVLELKGDVKERFFEALREFDDRICKELEEMYKEIYKPKGYKIDSSIKEICKKYGVRLGYG